MEDLDVATIARFLHITPAQVEKMASRDRLPGRKVGGQWVFNEAEIHHWLETKIGVTEVEDYDKLQGMIDRVTGESVDRPIAELCTVDSIAVPLAARTRGSVIRSMCDLAASGGMMWDAVAMAAAVAAREDMHPTALDNGVALLHPRRPQTSILADTVLALGITASPIPFSGGGQPTDVFFLICSYDDTAHLRTLSRLTRLIAVDGFLDSLRVASGPTEAWHAIADVEQTVGKL